MLAHGLNLAPAALPAKKTWKEPRSIAFFADKARNIPGVQDLGPSAYFISTPEQKWAAGLCGQEGLEGNRLLHRRSTRGFCEQTMAAESALRAGPLRNPAPAALQTRWCEALSLRPTQTGTAHRPERVHDRRLGNT